MQNEYNILVIDDDPFIIDAFRVIFEDMDNCTFYPSLNFQQGKKIIEEKIINLAIVDIVLPDSDGYEICRFIKKEPNSSNAHIILMSCDKNQVLDRIMAFKVGAQDFISKPFELLEVELMIKSKIEYHLKSQRTASDKPILSSGKFLIDSALKQVKIEQNEIDLAPLEYKLLTFFLSNTEKLIELDEILVNVWGGRYETSPENVRQRIFKLRKKIEKDPGNPVYLVNAKSSGYIFYPEGKPLMVNKLI